MAVCVWMGLEVDHLKNLTRQEGPEGRGHMVIDFMDIERGFVDLTELSNNVIQ
jgi:hypothetical protein